MRSPLLLLPSVVISIFITGCSKEQKENDLTKFNIKGDVKSIKYRAYDATVRFGEIEKENRKYYDEAYFNDEGNQVETIFYNPDGGINWKYTYEYDEEGNNVRVIEYKSDGSINSKYTSEYDEEGNQVGMIKYKSDGSIDRKYTNEYDEEGNQVETIFYMSDGKIRWKDTYEYDEEGNEVEKITYDSDGSIDYKYTYEYEFDIEKNWTSKITFEDDVATTVAEREFEYYD